MNTYLSQERRPLSIFLIISKISRKFAQNDEKMKFRINMHENSQHGYAMILIGIDCKAIDLTISPERLSISLVSLLISFFDSDVNPTQKKVQQE